MEFKIRSVALDFIVGGIIVAGALFFASLFGPVYGGIFAGAPIRAGSTIFLEGLQRGTKSATELTRGVVLANVGFSIALPSPTKVRPLQIFFSRQRCLPRLSCRNTKDKLVRFSDGC